MVAWRGGERKGRLPKLAQQSLLGELTESNFAFCNAFQHAVEPEEKTCSVWLQCTVDKNGLLNNSM